MSINRREFSDYQVLDSHQFSEKGTVAKKFMASVFLWMFLALGISSLFAYLYATNQALFNQLYVQTESGAVRPSIFGWVVTIAPFGLLFAISLGINKFSSAVLTVLFVLFAALFGISLSYILLVYTSGSVIGCFAAASAMFGIMAVTGYTTNTDLTKFGSILTMALIGVVIAMVINIFLHSNAMAYIISLVGVAVFTGLTAYDVQKLKRIGAGLEIEGVAANDTRKLALMGALNLYLDFINIFLFLLELFGDRRR